MGVGMEELGKLSNGEVVQMLRDCVWRAVKESWAVQAEQHSKLKVVNELRKLRCEATCIDVESKGIQTHPSEPLRALDYDLYFSGI